MPRLYGDPVSDEELAELLRRLRERGTPDAVRAANTLSQGPSRTATAETAVLVRETVRQELDEWVGLDDEAPRLASVRDRLAGSGEGMRVI